MLLIEETKQRQLAVRVFMTENKIKNTHLIPYVKAPSGKILTRQRIDQILNNTLSGFFKYESQIIRALGKVLLRSITDKEIYKNIPK